MRKNLRKTTEARPKFTGSYKKKRVWGWQTKVKTIKTKLAESIMRASVLLHMTLSKNIKKRKDIFFKVNIDNNRSTKVEGCYFQYFSVFCSVYHLLKLK